MLLELTVVSTLAKSEITRIGHPVMVVMVKSIAAVSNGKTEY